MNMTYEKPILFEYHLQTGSFQTNRSHFAMHPQISSFFDKLQAAVAEASDNSFEFSLTDAFHPDKEVRWYLCDYFVISEQDKPVRITGSIIDMTYLHFSRGDMQREASNLSLTQGKNSILEQTEKKIVQFSPEDFAKLAQGHQFMARLQEHMKYADDLSTELVVCLKKIAEYFHLDRVVVLETDLTNGTNTLNFQWNSREEDTLKDYFQYMSEEEIARTIQTYDSNGYIEVNPTHQIFQSSQINTRIIKNYVLDILLGTQLWIPTLSGGKYSGAIFFDKYDTTPYTPIEKFLLSELVNILSIYIEKINAENANRAKSDFLSTMSHEIRTPMNAIVGMTEVALREDMDSKLRHYLKTVQSSSLGLLALINDILDYSKIEAGKLEIVPEKFPVLSLVNDVYEIVKARNAEKLALHLHMPETLPSLLYGDIVRIKQVMINYCTNAIKYTDSGSVDIYISIEKTDETHCNFKFSVKDTGIGIKKEDIRKLFKQYGQVNTSVNHHKEGTGLGLMISKQLIDAMGGRVYVKSKYGKGSTFSFQIPLQVKNWSPAGKLEDYKYEETDKKSYTTFTAPDAKILVVDDIPLNLTVTKALLKPIGMRIETAADGYAALDCVTNTTYDLILMDHFMPGMDGMETTTRIRALENNPNQNIPIIALTADVVDGIKEELLSHGMSDYLSKPIIIDRVYPVLRRWLPKEKILK